MFYEMVKIGEIAIDSFLVKNSAKRVFRYEFLRNCFVSYFDVVRIFNSKKLFMIVSIIKKM